MRSSTPTLLLLALAACRGPAPTLPIAATPPAQLPPRDEIVRACAFEVSCLHDPPAATMQNCDLYFEAGLDNWLLPHPLFTLNVEPGEFRRWVDCANAAGDCRGVLECASRGHDAAYCAAHPGFGCDGDVLVQCPLVAATNDAAIFTTDCAAHGMRCVEAKGTAVCTDGVGCTTASQPETCDGNRYYTYCDETTGLRYRLDCARSSIPNATCRLSASASGCLPSGPPCRGDRCEGDLLVTCLAGQEVRVDCTQLDSTCAMVDGRPTCSAVASECDYSTSDACSGGDLTTCLNGALRAAGCDTIGLSSCTTTGDAKIPICG